MNPSNYGQLRPASRRSMNDSQQHMLANLWNSDQQHHSDNEDDSFRIHSSVEQLVGGQDVVDGLPPPALHVRRKTGRSSCDSLHMAPVGGAAAPAGAMQSVPEGFSTNRRER